MRMTGLEKRLVNRKRKAQRNVEMLSERLAELDTPAMHDALELGCGIGVVSAFLAESYGMNVHGTDFDPDQVRTARALNREGDRLHFGVADAARLPFASSSFDLVVSQNVFHHVPDWQSAVREISRVLRPNGCLIWYDLVFPGWIVKAFRSFLTDYGLYTFEQVRREVAAYGFETLFHERVAHGPFGHHHMVLQKLPDSLATRRVPQSC